MHKKEISLMKILFTSVGRRVELVQSFKNAAKELSIDLDVIGADMSKSAPALFFCDEKKIVPSITNPNYIEQLIDICKKESVDCLIPTIDTELIILAKYKNIFSTSTPSPLIMAFLYKSSCVLYLLINF